MIHENIKIDIDYEKLGIKHKGADAVFTTYIKEMYPDYQNVFERPLVIICPGGGYEHHSPREGEAVALKMLDFGYNAVVLRYSLMPDEFPCALYEAAYTINYVRNHAKEWDINPDKIIIAGFSAGGHVAASLATMYDQPELADFIQNVLHVSPKEVRPDGLLLGYPVITSGSKAHRKSFERLLGDRYDELVKSVSLEERVSSNTPKTFLWHTFSDGSVSVDNSLLFAESLKKQKFRLNFIYSLMEIMDLDLERKRLIQRTENILSRKYTSGQNFLKHGLKKISDGVKYGE